MTWIRAEDGGLVNLDRADRIEVVPPSHDSARAAFTVAAFLAGGKYPGRPLRSYPIGVDGENWSDAETKATEWLGELATELINGVSFWS